MAKKTPRFTVEAGRQIYLDGAPFIGVTREGDTYPSIADELTREIARLLNASTRVRAMLDKKVRYSAHVLKASQVI